MSSPSRSDTNHLMVESLLQQKAGLKDGNAVDDGGKPRDHFIP